MILYNNDVFSITHTYTYVHAVIILHCGLRNIITMHQMSVSDWIYTILF